MRKLNKRELVIVKLAVWSGLIVWIFFFFLYSGFIAMRFSRLGPEVFGVDFEGRVLSFILPVWVIFTSLLTVYYISRWAKRKLK